MSEFDEEPMSDEMLSYEQFTDVLIKLLMQIEQPYSREVLGCARSLDAIFRAQLDIPNEESFLELLVPNTASPDQDTLS